MVDSYYQQVGYLLVYVLLFFFLSLFISPDTTSLLPRAGNDLLEKVEVATEANGCSTCSSPQHAQAQAPKPKSEITNQWMVVVASRGPLAATVGGWLDPNPRSPAMIHWILQPVPWIAGSGLVLDRWDEAYAIC